MSMMPEPGLERSIDQYLPTAYDTSDMVWPKPVQQVGQVPLTGGGKLASQFVRGATVGVLGDPLAPQGVAEHLAEGAGMIVPGAAASMALGPAVGAAPLTRLLAPPVQRIITGGLSGAVTGGAHAGFTGGNPLQEILIGGALGAGAEAGWVAWANRAKLRSGPEQIKEAVETRALGLPPPGPPVRAPQVPPGPGGPRRGATATILSNEPAPPGALGVGAVEAPGGLSTRPPGPSPYGPTGPDYPISSTGPLGQSGPSPLALASPKVFGQSVRPPRPSGEAAEQLYLPDMGSTQMQLPMHVFPSGRMNRYTTPTRFKGAYETAELAASEADAVAAAAAREGVQQVRVTTAIQPRVGPATGGLIRVYQATPGGGAQLVSEKALNVGATKAGQVGASPMRRVVPDYFKVEYDANLGTDVLTPLTNDVESGLRTAMGIDPQQATFPLSPEQTSFLNSVAGRAIREKLDIRAKHWTTDDIIKMDEPTARATLIDGPDKAPPMMASASIHPSPAAVEARGLINKLELGDDEVAQFVSSLGRSSNKAKFDRILAWLGSKCGGPGAPGL